MKVRMRTSAAGPEGAYAAGAVCEVPDELAAAFVAGGYAEEVTAAEVEAGPEPPEPEGEPEAEEPTEEAASEGQAEETATAEPPERAVRPRPRGRRVGARKPKEE